MTYQEDIQISQNTGAHGRSKPGFFRRWVKIILPIFVVLGALSGVVLMGMFKPKAETKDEPPRSTPVVTVYAQARPVALNVTSQGEVRPRTAINLAAQVGGRVNWLAPGFLEGGRFLRGEVLMRIETAEYDLRVTQAQANVAQAQTVLTREVSESEIAARDWEDLGQGEASPLTLRKPQMAEAEARVAAAKAVLGEATLQQSRSVVRAPFEGRVSERLVSMGDTIAPGQNIGRIFAVDIAEVKLPLTDIDMSRLGLGIGFVASKSQPGPEAVLSAVVAGVPHTWHGRITRTSSSYDPATRVLFGYVQVDDPYGKGADRGVPLAAGLFVSVKIAGREIANSIVVPRTALRGTDTVYIANTDNTLSLRTVMVASSTREMVVINGGLSAGERVITSPIRGVAEGMKIEIADFQDDEQKSEDGEPKDGENGP